MAMSLIPERYVACVAHTPTDGFEDIRRPPPLDT